MARARPTPPALVFGSHITALSVLRLLRRRGIPAYVVDDTSDIIVRSRWYRPAERRLAETSDGSELGAYLDGLSLPTAVLLPCSDRWTQAVAALEPRLRERFVASVAPRPVVDQFIDKQAFAELVEELQIPRPRTFPLASAEDLAALADADVQEGFLKPRESHRFYSHFGTKGQFVGSREEAARFIRRGEEHGVEFMLQEWIPGGIPNTILIDGFVDRHGTLAALVGRRRVRMDPPRIANTCVCMTIPLADIGEAVEDTRRLLAAVPYRGIFSVEFKQDARDGRFKIIELNTRPFWHINHIARAGVDLAWMAYRDALGERIDPVSSYEAGRFGIYEVSEIAALIRAVSRGHRPDGPVIRPWLRGDHILLWASDPLPGLFDLSAAAAERIKSLGMGLRRQPRGTS